MRFVPAKFVGVFVMALGMTFVRPGVAQERVKVGATAYVDYFYNLDAPLPEREDLHGFTYRRLYLTADYEINEAFDSRVRLEANQGTSGSSGPVPFVKDLWVRWTSPGGHQVTGGVQPPPVYEATEAVWGFRSLEKTTLDLFGVNDSRDFGLRVNGPLLAGGRLRYAAMVGNGDAVRPETDRYKRAYAQLEARPAGPLVFTLGGDYATYPDDREGAVRLSAMAGYVGAAFAAGVEAFQYRVAYSEALVFDGRRQEAETTRGVSVFGRATVSPGWQVVGRVDRVRVDPLSLDVSDVYQTFAVAGVAYAPVPAVRLIPNLHYQDRSSLDPAVTARFTLELNL